MIDKLAFLQFAANALQYAHLLGTVELDAIRMTLSACHKALVRFRHELRFGNAMVLRDVTNQFIDVRFPSQGRAVVIDVNGKVLPIRPICANPD